MPKNNRQRQPAAPPFLDVWPDKVAAYCLYVLVAAVPLAFIYQTYDIFELTKVTVLRLVTLVLLGAWAGIVYRDRRLNIARTPLDWFVVAYLGVMALATVFSRNPRLSLLGEYGRFEGLLTIGNYALVFLLAGTLIRNNRFIKDTSAFIKNLMLTAVGAAALVSVYGIAQRFGLDFLTWSSAGTDVTRSFSTLGNPIYVAAYTTVMLSVAVALFVVEHDIRWRIFLGTAATLIATCLIMTYSRAGWAGAIVALAVLAVLGALIRRQKRQGENNKAQKGKAQSDKSGAMRFLPYILLVAAVIVVISVAVTVSERGASAPTQSALARALSSFNLKSAGLADRVSLWKSGAAMIKDRPVLGWGPETFGTYYSRYRRMDLVTFERTQMNLHRPRHQNRVHSDILQQGLSAGIPGILSYATLFAGFFFLALRRSFARHTPNNPNTPYAPYDQAILVAIIAGLAGYLVQIQVSFSTIGITPIVWLFMALAFIITDPNRVVASEAKQPQRSANLFPRVSLFIILMLLILLAIGSIRPLLADYYFDRAITAVGRADSQSAKELFDQAFSLNPLEPEYFNYAGNQFVELAKHDTDKDLALADLTTAVSYVDRALALNPDMAGYHYNLGNAEYYYSMVPGLDKTRAEQDMLDALGNYQIAVKYDPYQADYHFNLASAYLRFGRKTQSIAELKTGLRIDPTRSDAKLWLQNLTK